MKNLFKINVLIILLSITSCQINFGQNKVKGNRNVIEKNRNIASNFSKIKVSNGLDVFISEGNTTKIVVEADENLHEIIKTEIEDGTLKIYSEKNIWRAKARKVYVTTSTLNTVSASSGSDVIVEDFFTSENFKASVSSGADLTVRINAKTISGSSSSGADLKLIGKAENAKLSSSSGSDLDASDLVAKNVTANASSGSDIEANATESVTANASSGGDIDFEGNPKEINKKASSGGSVDKK